MAKNISDQDRARINSLRANRTLSDADRAAMIREILGEGSKTISDQDRARAEELLYMKRNDGGMAKKTRMF
jgi:hypothetical protein